MMSISEHDLIRIPYDDSLSLAGAIYACRSLHYGYKRLGHASPHQLRRMVATVASELALRRWLDAESVPYNLIETTPFTRPQYLTLTLGGRRLDCRSALITSRHRIRRIRRNPSWLLEFEALIPVEQLASETLNEGDPFAFIFLIGLETRTRADLGRAIAASQPTYLIATPPSKTWRQPDTKQPPLGQLELQSTDPNYVEIEIVGQHTDNTLQAMRTVIYPDRPTKFPSDLTSLTYVHSTRLPTGTISIYSPVLNDTWEVGGHNWFNVWIYGQEVILAGWCTKSYFRRHALFLPERNRTHLGWRLREDHYFLSTSHLRPMRELAERIRQG
jgi:hypothetical protein